MAPDDEWLGGRWADLEGPGGDVLWFKEVIFPICIMKPHEISWNLLEHNELVASNWVYTAYFKTHRVSICFGGRRMIVPESVIWAESWLIRDWMIPHQKDPFFPQQDHSHESSWIRSSVRKSWTQRVQDQLRTSLHVFLFCFRRIKCPSSRKPAVTWFCQDDSGTFPELCIHFELIFIPCHLLLTCATWQYRAPRCKGWFM